jgi:divalent metal cation (Fe/Co/Zn/Cd) transporter
MWFSVDFIHYGIGNVSNLTATIADALLELIDAGISGAVIAAVLGMIAGAQEAPQTE